MTTSPSPTAVVTRRPAPAICRRLALVLLAFLALAGRAALAPAPASAELYNPGEVVDAAAPILDQYWAEIFAAEGLDYDSPAAIWWYNTADHPGEAESACGTLPLNNAVYCPLDASLYLDAQFLWANIDAHGDFAVALVVAHEWAHHVEMLVGVGSDRYYSIQIELLADCWAGSATAYMDALGMLEAGDLDEAYALTLTMGDEHAGNVAATDPGAHGTSDQRLTAFFAGYELADAGACWPAVDEIVAAG